MSKHATRDPFSDKNLGLIFKFDSAKPDRVLSRESTSLEFKEAFNWSNNSKYAKTMAGFANNSGGYIVFGVANRPRRAVGMRNARFDDIDPADIAEFLNSVLLRTQLARAGLGSSMCGNRTTSQWSRYETQVLN